jgi:hypothetical protein
MFDLDWRNHLKIFHQLVKCVSEYRRIHIDRVTVYDVNTPKYEVEYDEPFSCERAQPNMAFQEALLSTYQHTKQFFGLKNV